MSETNTTTETVRPWHGHANPLEALHDWMKAELAALEARLSPAKAQMTNVGTTDPNAAAPLVNVVQPPINQTEMPSREMPPVYYTAPPATE